MLPVTIFRFVGFRLLSFWVNKPRFILCGFFLCTWCRIKRHSGEESTPLLRVSVNDVEVRDFPLFRLQYQFRKREGKSRQQQKPIPWHTFGTQQIKRSVESTLDRRWFVIAWPATTKKPKTRKHIYVYTDDLLHRRHPGLSVCSWKVCDLCRKNGGAEAAEAAIILGNKIRIKS